MLRFMGSQRVGHDSTIYKIEKQQHLICSRGNYIQYIVIIYKGKEFKNIYISVHAKLLQSSPTLCNPMDHIPPTFFVHEIL